MSTGQVMFIHWFPEGLVFPFRWQFLRWILSPFGSEQLWKSLGFLFKFATLHIVPASLVLAFLARFNKSLFGYRPMCAQVIWFFIFYVWNKLLLNKLICVSVDEIGTPSVLLKLISVYISQRWWQVFYHHLVILRFGSQWAFHPNWSVELTKHQVSLFRRIISKVIKTRYSKTSYYWNPYKHHIV